MSCSKGSGADMHAALGMRRGSLRGLCSLAPATHSSRIPPSFPPTHGPTYQVLKEFEASQAAAEKLAAATDNTGAAGGASASGDGKPPCVDVSWGSIRSDGSMDA